MKDLRIRFKSTFLVGIFKIIKQPFKIIFKEESNNNNTNKLKINTNKIAKFSRIKVVVEKL